METRDGGKREMEFLLHVRHARHMHIHTQKQAHANTGTYANIHTCTYLHRYTCTHTVHTYMHMIAVLTLLTTHSCTLGKCRWCSGHAALSSFIHEKGQWAQHTVQITQLINQGWVWIHSHVSLLPRSPIWTSHHTWDHHDISKNSILILPSERSQSFG